MGRILFWGMLLFFKCYIYFRMVQLFKRPLYRRLAAFLGLCSFLVLGAGVYVMLKRFGGISGPTTFFSNFSTALMVTFFVFELVVTPFFLLDDLFGLSRWTYHYFTAKNQAETAVYRRSFLKKAGLLIGALPFSSFLYGITWGKYNFTVHNHQLVFEDLPDAFDGFRIGQISDIHSGSFDSKSAVQKGLQLLQDQQVDVILFTGDLVNTYAAEIEPYMEDLKQLRAPYGKFSVLGNHDYPMYHRMFDSEEHKQENLQKIKDHYVAMDFKLLLNENAKLEKDGQYIRLLGVENWGRSRHFPKLGDLDLATADCEENEFTVLMSHDPTHWEDKVKAYQKHIHLTLSGHTHGMQMGIDLPSFKWSPIKYSYKHWAGLYKEEGKFLHVNRGFGFLAFAGRVGVFPEITVLELKKG